MNIKIISVIEEFKSGLNGRKIGIYRVSVGDRKLTICRNGDSFKALQHGLNGDTLDSVTDKFRTALIEILGADDGE